MVRSRRRIQPSSVPNVHRWLCLKYSNQPCSVGLRSVITLARLRPTVRAVFARIVSLNLARLFLRGHRGTSSKLVPAKAGTSGLRWLSLMVVVPISWSGRHWALPFLTVLAPSARWSEKHRKRHKTLTGWARQAILQTKRWLPNRLLIFVADSGFAALELLASVRWHVCVITRLRQDAALFKPPPRRRKGQRGRPPLKGGACRRCVPCWPARKPSGRPWSSRNGTTPSNASCSPPSAFAGAGSGTAVWYHAGIPPVPSAADASWHIDALRASIRWVLVRDPTGEHEPAAFLSTHLDATPAMILGWFVSRWRVETTFQEVPTHLGVETQCQWSDLAILRTTAALLGLFSRITVWADGLARDTTTPLRPNAAAWYRKQEPTFSDAIAAVRRVLWCPPNFSMSRQIGDIIEIPASLLNRVFQTLCLAA